MAELNYKTFDQLCASVEKDLRTYTSNNLFFRNDFIKTAKKINSQLGIKINGKKQTILYVENYKADIPINMLSCIAMVAFSEKIDYNLPPKFLSSEITTHEIISHIESRKIKTIRTNIVKPSTSSFYLFCKNSINRMSNSDMYQVSVDDNVFIFNFESGIIYLEYVPHMEDDDGNLLVLDHPLVNEYYEEAIKERFFRLLWHNKDADTYNMYVESRDVVLPRAKNKAEAIVRIPEYKKMREYSRNLEREWYNKWVSII